jgi:serine/threonine-protein kinase
MTYKQKVYGMITLVVSVIVGSLFIIQTQTVTSTLDLRSTETPLANSARWEPVTKVFDGVEMVMIPAGCFWMGSTEDQIDAAFQSCKGQYGNLCQQDWFDDERSQHEVCFDAPFWIDKYEVTNEQFAAFDGQAENPSDFSEADHPRENITWLEARDFCVSRGARLPTEAEWEYAARGSEGLIYPWGNEWDCSVVNTDDETVRDRYVIIGGAGCDGFDETAPVGSIPGGVSWVGAYDLSGNVNEWVSSLYQPYPYDAADGREDSEDTTSDRVVRGGSWFSNLVEHFRTVDRNSGPPDAFINHIGFRCARSD